MDAISKYGFNEYLNNLDRKKKRRGKLVELADKYWDEYFHCRDLADFYKGTGLGVHYKEIADESLRLHNKYRKLYTDLEGQIIDDTFVASMSDINMYEDALYKHETNSELRFKFDE